MDEQILSRIASDVSDIKADSAETKADVKRMFDALYVRGADGRPPLIERVALLEAKERSRTWFDRTVIGAWIVVIVGGVASIFHFRGH